MLRYDNLKSAVKHTMRGKRREQTTRFLAFRSHYLFEADFCTPARGNEKGGVEQEAGRFRRRWWTPLPQHANLGELNNYLLAYCHEDHQRKIEGRDQSVGEAFREEQLQLTKNPAEDFEVAESLACVVDGSSYVRVKCNRYSTPLRHGVRVQANIDASHVNVFCEGKSIARHERSYLVKQEVLALEHSRRTRTEAGRVCAFESTGAISQRWVMAGKLQSVLGEADGAARPGRRHVRDDRPVAVDYDAWRQASAVCG